ncbi:hypothetical protein [Mycobacterium sp.]|uniref:hypothetical protein n=1 Tax=Mycobacterium sp. TaxID=1785 RepID=UPI003BAA59C8
MAVDALTTFPAAAWAPNGVLKLAWMPQALRPLPRVSSGSTRIPAADAINFDSDSDELPVDWADTLCLQGTGFGDRGDCGAYEVVRMKGRENG